MGVLLPRLGVIVRHQIGAIFPSETPGTPESRLEAIPSYSGREKVKTGAAITHQVGNACSTRGMADFVCVVICE